MCMFSSKKYRTVTCLFFLCLIISCSSKFVIVDESGMTFSLSRTRLKGSNKIEILDGEAVRYIPLSKIQKLVLDPTTTHYKNNKLYYHAQIDLIDGTEIKPRIVGATTTKSFVNIDNVIIGRASSGTVTIPLQNINVISIAEIEE